MTGYEPVGRGFESLPAHQKTQLPATGCGVFFYPASDAAASVKAARHTISCTGEYIIKNSANIITLLRIPLAAAMLFSPPFSALFWVFYSCCGLTDILDGIVARKLKAQSALGAKLDSIADAAFALAVAVVLAVNAEIPPWLWLCALGVALLRFISYAIGFYKYRTFASLHTYTNKLTGALVFASPIFFSAFGINATGVILCVFAAASALEELIITVKSSELNRECKSVFDSFGKGAPR